MSSTDPTSQGWRLDKRLPLASIMLILANTSGFVWWMSSLNSDVERNTAAIERLIEEQAGFDKTTTRVTVLEQTILYQTQTLERLEGKIDDLNRRLNDRRD